MRRGAGTGAKTATESEHTAVADFEAILKTASGTARFREWLDPARAVPGN